MSDVKSLFRKKAKGGVRVCLSVCMCVRLCLRHRGHGACALPCHRNDDDDDASCPWAHAPSFIHLRTHS